MNRSIAATLCTLAALSTAGCGGNGSSTKPPALLPATPVPDAATPTGAAPAAKEAGLALGGFQPGATVLADFEKATGAPIAAGAKSAGEIQRASIAAPKLTIGETAAERLQAEFVDGILTKLVVGFPAAATESVRKTLTETWGAAKENGEWSKGATTASLAEGELTILDAGRQKVAAEILEVKDKEPKAP